MRMPSYVGLFIDIIDLGISICVILLLFRSHVPIQRCHITVNGALLLMQKFVDVDAHEIAARF